MSHNPNDHTTAQSSHVIVGATSSTIGTIALCHRTADGGLLDTVATTIRTDQVEVGESIILDSATFGELSIGIHPSFDFSDRSSPRINIALRAHGPRGHGLDYLRRFWTTVADYMAADSASLLGRAIENTIENVALD